MAGLSKTGANDAPIGQLLGGDNVTIPLGNKPYSTPYNSIGLEICENMYVEYSPSENSVAPYYYISRPGLKRWIRASGSSSPACRGLYTTGTGLTYGVFGKNVYQINSNSTKTKLGELLTQVGTVRFADNGTQCILVDGTNGYIIEMTAATITKITDEYFPGVADPTKGPSHVVALDTYFIVNSSGTNKYYWSTPGYIPYAFDEDHPEITHTWWGTYFQEKFTDSDNIVAIEKVGSWLYVFGSRSIEVHYNTGNLPNTFQRTTTAPISFGTYSKSVTRFMNTIYFMGSDQNGTTGIFAIDNSYSPKRISTRGVEDVISLMSKYHDMVSWAYSQAGHSFVCFWFPSGNITWVYDIVTDAWHKRTFYEHNSGRISAWQSVYATQTSYSKLITGHRWTDAIYDLDMTYYSDDNPYTTDLDRIQRLKSTPIQFNQARNARYIMAQVLIRAGVGLVVNDALDTGLDPKVVVKYSNDSGSSWIPNAGIPLSFGRMGDYAHRCIAHGLGIGRNRTWLFEITDPVPVVLYGFVISYKELAR